MTRPAPRKKPPKAPGATFRRVRAPEEVWLARTVNGEWIVWEDPNVRVPRFWIGPFRYKLQKPELPFPATPPARARRKKK